MQSSSDTLQSSGEFSDMITYQLQLLDEDDDADEQPRRPNGQVPASDASSASSHQWTKLKLTELFDISSSLWSTRYGNFASFTYEEELELYDLIDLDGDGDIDIEVDSGVADVLES